MATNLKKHVIFKRAEIPTPPPPESDNVKASNELRRLAMAEEEKSGCSISSAYNRVLQTDRGRELYARIYGGTGQAGGSELEKRTMQTEICKADLIESTMDALAEQAAAATGITIAAAYSDLLDCDQGFRDLYAERQDAMRDPGEIAKRKKRFIAERGVIAKVATTDADTKLDALAKTHAETHKVDFAKAYNAVLDTPEGAALYAQHRDERRAA